MVKTLAAVALLAALTGCATIPIPLGIPCSIGPFIPDKGASHRWTRSEKEYLVTLDETGQKLCGWKLPRG